MYKYCLHLNLCLIPCMSLFKLKHFLNKIISVSKVITNNRKCVQIACTRWSFAINEYVVLIQIIIISSRANSVNEHDKICHRKLHCLVQLSNSPHNFAIILSLASISRHVVITPQLDVWISCFWKEIFHKLVWILDHCVQNHFGHQAHVCHTKGPLLKKHKFKV